MELTEKLLDFIEKEDEKFKKFHKTLKENEFYSTQSGICGRQVYYIKKYGYKIDSETKKVFKIGSIIHDFFQKSVFEPSKNQFEIPIQIKETPIIIRGRIDVISLETNELIELKSCMFLPKEPDQKYVSQLNMYLSNSSYKKGRLIFISKNNLEIRQFPTQFNKNLFQEDILRLKLVYESLKTNTLPEKELSKLCKYCKYSEKCKGDLK